MKMSKAIEGYAIDRIADGYSHSTIESYKYSLNILVNFLGDPEIEKVTVADLKGFFHYLRTEYIPNRANGNTRPLTRSALHGKWKAIRSLWNWISQELNIESVAKKIPAPKYTTKPIIPFTQEEIEHLLNACAYTAPAHTMQRKRYKQRRPTARRDKALVLLLLDTGLRVGEVERLLIEDVDLKTGEVSVLPYGQVHKTKGRTVYLGRSARKAIWRYLATRQDIQDFDPLFLNYEGYPLTRNAIKSLCRRLGERANITKCYPHKFRHTFAIQYLRNDGDVFTLQMLLGHTTLDMVNKYLALSNTDSAAAHRRASPVDR